MEEQEVAADRQKAHVLNEVQVAQLVKLGTAIEQHYSVPQDKAYY